MTRLNVHVNVTDEDTGDFIGESTFTMDVDVSSTTDPAGYGEGEYSSGDYGT